MVRFAPADPFDDETPAAGPLGAAPVALPRRRSRRLAAPSIMPTNPLLQQAFPSWARPPATGVVGTDGAFFAGTGLALFDRILRSGEGGSEPVFVGVLRQRLALKAAAACARLARLREDEGALRDAEHLASVGARSSPAGRIHRLWRGFAAPSVGFDEPSLRKASDLLELPRDLDFEAFAGTLRLIAQGQESPLTAAARAGSATLQALDSVARVDAEILALWLSDLMLARKLGWDAPIALLATTIAHPSPRRGPSGKRPRPADPDWVDAAVGAYAMAAQEAYVLAGELSRRTEKLLAVQSKLRAKGAGRVVELLLSDDAVSPARAAKAARLSDRAARRLFDRLIELEAVRELSGRPSFRLYGL